MARLPRCIFRPALLLAAGAVLFAASTQTGDALAPALAEPASALKDSKLSGPLPVLAAHARSAAERGQPFDYDALPAQLRALSAARVLRFDEQGSVVVAVSFDGPPGAAAAALRSAGARVEQIVPRRKLALVDLPAARLDAVAALPEVQRVRPPDYPFVAAGSVTTQGDAIHNADDVRNSYGLTGAGVRIGIISDGVAGLAQAQSSGDLGAVNIATCNIVPPNASLKARPDIGPGVVESRDPTWAYAGAEGTAMLEIAHDLAPGAELWFGYFGAYLTNYGTIDHFMQAVDCLSHNVDIVVDDLYGLNVGPYDGTSSMSLNSSANLNNGFNPIRGFYKAGGNQALEHYDGPYVDSGQNFTSADLPPPTPPGDFWDLHRYSGTAGTSDAGAGLACGCADTIRLLPGSILVAYLQWNDPFGGTSNDYDFFLKNRGNGQMVGIGGGEQNGDDDPTEFIVYFNDTFFAQTLDLYIGNYRGLAAPRSFEQFFVCFACEPLVNGTSHNYNTIASSIPNNSDAGGGVVSLGAVPASNPGVAEPYSSRGPTNDGRNKPDGAATDDVAVTGSGGFPPSFPGTSASAPHAAAMAALLLECNPALLAAHDPTNPAAERDRLRTYLLDTAVDLGAPGVDTTFGVGRLDALAAANYADCDDQDGDGARDGHEAWLGSDPLVPDTDGDGCLDGREGGRVPQQGGRRNPTNPYDFFDVPLPAGPPGSGVNDRIISTGDIVGVVSKFGTFDGGPPNDRGQVYNPAFDRRYLGPDPWDTVAGNGRTTIEDIVLVVTQFGHSCA